MMEERLDFIPCLTFVKRGVAKARPEKIKPTKEELQEIMKEMKLKEAEYQGRPEAEQDVQMKGEDSDSDAAVDEYYNMDNYDDEPTDTATSIPIENLILQNADDSDDDDDEDEDTDDEPDEFTIQPTDNPILVGHVEDDACMLEVYVFNNDRAELFILHDIFLPSYPLSIEWLNFDPKNSENPAHFAAVGNMSNKIDIWDLNVTGCLEPAYSLGGKKAKGVKHKDAVITLAWNESTRNVLASGSADNTVILWNLADQKALTKLSVFEDKVQSIKWHPVENHNLLTGSCEGKVRLFDCRSTSTFKTWIFDGEIEKIMWNKLDPTYYFATTNAGMVHYVDIRNPKPVWNLKAHDKEVTGIALSSHCPDLLVTGSMDETVKVWDLKDQIPHHVANKNMNIGSIYTLESCMDVPYVFCAGGSKKDNNLYLWDVRESDPVMERFKDRRLEELARPDSSSGTMDESGPSSSSSALRQFGNADGRIRKTKNRSAIESVNSESTGSGAEAGDDARPKKVKKSSSKS